MAHQAGAFPSFSNMKRLGVFLHSGTELIASHAGVTGLFLLESPAAIGSLRLFALIVSTYP